MVRVVEKPLSAQVFRELGLDDLTGNQWATLGSWIGRQVKGSSEVQRTDILPDFTYGTALDALEAAIGPAPFSALEELDNQERQKVGPLSVMFPWSEREGDLRAYWEQSFDPDIDALDWATSQVISLVPKESLLPSDLSAAFGLMRKGTNSGLPHLSRAKSVLNSYKQRVPEFEQFAECYPSVVALSLIHI